MRILVRSVTGEGNSCGAHFTTTRTGVSAPHRNSSGFSSAFHKESLPSTASAQRLADFLLMLREPKRRVCDIQARCSVSPARALRQSWRFLAILEGEWLGGILQERASARNWLPGRCGLLTESSTHGRTGRWPPQCCRLICEVRFANGGLLNACLRHTLRRDDGSCAPPCLVRGTGPQNISPSNAARVAGPGRICF